MTPTGTRMMVADRVPRRRTDAIIDAIVAELTARRSSLDPDGTVRSVTVITKLKQGSLDVRAVIVTVETERTLST